MQNLGLHPTQIDGANVSKQYPNPVPTLPISYMYPVFVMSARNLWDKFVSFFCYMLSRASSGKLVDQNQNRRSFPGKWYKPHGITLYKGCPRSSEVILRCIILGHAPSPSTDRESRVRYSRARSFLGSVIPGTGNPGFSLSDTDNYELPNPGKTESGNDRAREGPNPGSSEPGKFGLGACLVILAFNKSKLYKTLAG